MTSGRRFGNAMLAHYRESVRRAVHDAASATFGHELADVITYHEGEPMSTETITLLCVCDEEWCYCTNKVEVEIPPWRTREDGAAVMPPMPEVPCAECAAGHHVLDPGGPRS